MSLKKFSLELARNQGLPEGSRSHGYEFVARLDSRKRIDPNQVELENDKCGVARFWGNDEREHPTASAIHVMAVK
jgi:hypothetical protein